MFVFEDITQLDDIHIQRVLRDVNPKDLVLALRNAKDEVKTVVFKNMSTRSAESVKEEMGYQRSVRTRDMEAAQQKIVAIIRELEEKGDIIVNRGKEDEVV
jgi:flagellar motor switch protein FliG